MSDAYFDFHWPLSIIQLIVQILFGKPTDPNSPAPPTDAASREWLSQPRTASDPTTEVITTRFKLPLSLSEIGWEALRVPSHWEVWYQDRSNNWLQMRDLARIPITVDLSGSDSVSWYKFHSQVYPIVAKAVQYRIKRNFDTELQDVPYPVGMKNALMKRNVYDRSQGVQYLEDEQDPYGNVISKYIRDWDAPKAADDNPSTFWKCAPQPDPAAVVSMYLDVSADDGSPRLIDKVYIDPVYTGQHLNLYYSNDPTVSTLKLSPISVPPVEDVDTDWRLSRGRLDIGTDADQSYYRFKGNFGPMIERDIWIGIEWTPTFAPDDGPAINPILLGVMPSETPVTQFAPRVVYDVGAGEIKLEFDNGDDVIEYALPLSPVFKINEPLRIVAGWSYNPDKVYIKVTDRSGNVLGMSETSPSTLPSLVSMDGLIEMYCFRGLMTNTIIKSEHWNRASNFLQNPTTYTSPEPVIPDPDGSIPSTTLDNAIYAASWVYQEHGTGGLHETSFESKEWTPIWRDYVAEKGMLFFPQTINMKYLKLEFTNLTEEPYPIYDSGIDVKYKVFPISVQQQSSVGPHLYTTGSGGFLGLGNFISVNGVRSVNWLNPFSVLDAVNTVFGKTVEPVQIQTGPGYVSDTLPNTPNSTIQNSTRVEFGSSYVYRRDVIDPYVLSRTETETIIKAEGLQKLSPYTDIPWKAIEAANPGAIQKKSSPGALPMQGSDWWIFPGQTLKIPAAVMEKLTDTSTVIDRKLTLEHRVRFTTTAVHRYEIRTLKRDAAIAYFAGLREVIAFVTTYIPNEDKDVFEFTSYDSSQWVLNDTKKMIEGPMTTQGHLYTIENGGFDRSMANWHVETGDWAYDGTTGHWPRGSAKVTADGEENTMVSNQFDLFEGDEIDFTLQIKWDDLDAPADGDMIASLGIRTFLDDVLVDEDVIVGYEWDTVDSDTTQDWITLSGTYTVPAGVNEARLVLKTYEEADGGIIHMDSVRMPTIPLQATLFKALQTTTTFAKVKVDFRDSGLVRSNAMWADANPDSQSIEDTLLAPYVETIPGTLPGGMWGDFQAGWASGSVEWGSPIPVVSITIDGDRRYQGKRVIHFRKASGTGESGIKVLQWTNYVPEALFRIGAVFYKPFANNNLITIRMRRMSDGVYIHEETIPAPVGRWHEFQTRFIQVPDIDPAEGGTDGYQVSLTVDGDSEDELYLSDLYTELALIRYFIRLGGSGQPLQEVTDLRYADSAQITRTAQTNEVAVQAAILSPKAYAYGCTIRPTFLR